MFIHCPLKHSLKDLVDNFNLAISLRVIRQWILVFEAQQRGYLMPYLIFKVSDMVGDQLFQNPKSSHYMVK